jgi:hypothetical protein
VRARRVAAVLGACALAAVAVAVWAPWDDEEEARVDVEALPAPFAAGNSAANMTLSGSDAWVLVRWVARASGTLAALHLRIQADGARCRRSGRTGYGRGSGGSWRVSTHPVRPDGLPDTRRELAAYEFRPCAAPRAVVDVRQGIARVPMRLALRAGDERATIIRNTDPVPSENFTSTNFLHLDDGVRGANGRNERSARAGDAFYGLDPRELVGYSSEGGRSWTVPGGQYGERGGRDFLPTYVQEFSDGRVAGQPYYYASAAARGDRTMRFAPARRRWVVRGLGAYTPERGTGTLALTVNGRPRARATVSGRGLLRTAIAPVTVEAGQVVRVTASGLTLQDVVADTAWGRLVGLHTASAPWRLEGQQDFSRAAPVYPLPAPPAADAAAPAAG